MNSIYIIIIIEALDINLTKIFYINTLGMGKQGAGQGGGIWKELTVTLYAHVNL